MAVIVNRVIEYTKLSRIYLICGKYDYAIWMRVFFK